MDDIINLNVGGQKFTTSRTTLLKFPDSLLAKMFTNADVMAPAARDEDGAYIIPDGIPKYFEPILNYMRRGRLIIEDGVDYLGVLDEANYLCVQAIVDVLEERRKEDLELEERKKEADEFKRKMGWISINVRGKIFEGTRDIFRRFNMTVSSREVINHLFWRLAEDKPKEGEVFVRDVDGSYLIDFDPGYIQTFIDFLRTGHIKIDLTKRDIEGIEAVGEFVGLNRYGTRFKSRISYMREDLDKLLKQKENSPGCSQSLNLSQTSGNMD